ncbi:transglutaminase-like putative cysteine protease [Ciceribacter lividus]|uniref:Transglutaminase-like putative cysteine protease n=1 Tax=Ciceribacter lividus TaxID=1197950 RepID=A0A6I7HRY7_9HYPH|nr:transglutaminase family protein [Ciceribacter lividus]RCW28090.1 transglutaminase-like putative cysteine protease [Ciceribacter lividus]
MRLKITHTTEYRYDQPVSYSLQRLRLTPQTSPGQTVLSWQVAVDGAAVEVGYDDHFGNHVQLVAGEGGDSRLHIVASGEVDTEDRAGVFGPHVGDAPLWLFNRETPRTKAGRLVRELARGLPEDDPLARMHALMNAIHDSVSYQPGMTGTETTAEEALKAGHGVCQDHAHIFIAAARVLDIPARYISGYLMMDGQEEQTATHAWAEVHLPGLGWVGFDAANRVCPDSRYVRIASGLCYADAAPVSGMRIGPAGENLSVAVVVRRQEQAQSQN